MSTNNEQEAKPAISAHIVDLRIGFIPSLPDGTNVDYSVALRAFEDIPKLLDNWEGLIVQKTNELLLANEATPTADPDGIFVYHTNYVDFCIRSFLAQRARRLWRNRISFLVDASEARLRVVNPGARIHRGAPLFNVGICSFVLGDFDRAVQFIAEAGAYDEGLGRGKKIKILIGDHSLSEQIIVRPLERLLNRWAPDYAKITGFVLNNDELKRVLLSLADRPSDAVQAVVALHRLARVALGPENHGAFVVRFRALAELLHLVESFLRQFQVAVTGELGAHLKVLVAANPIVAGARAKFAGDRDAWIATAGCDRHSSQAMNWISNEAASRITSAPTPANATGFAIFFCHQFRNSLLHENEESLSIFQSKDECQKAAGWVLGVLRACARAKEGKFSTADFS